MTGWWTRVPATVREPIRSAALSAMLALQTAFLVLLGSAAADGHISSPGDLLGYIATHWWGVVIGLVLPAAYRAREASIRVANTVTLPSGDTAVLTPKGSP